MNKFFLILLVSALSACCLAQEEPAIEGSAGPVAAGETEEVDARSNFGYRRPIYGGSYYNRGFYGAGYGAGYGYGGYERPYNPYGASFGYRRVTGFGYHG